MKTENQNSEKWAWATPEKFNPEHRKHSFQGALLLIGFGTVLTALGLFLAWKFDTWSVEKFTGYDRPELLRRNTSDVTIIMFLFNSPWLTGLMLIAGGIYSLSGKYCLRYDKWKPYKK